MLFARPHPLLRRFALEFHRFIPGKFYLAVVRGAFPEERVVVDAPLAEAGEPPVRYRMLASPSGRPCRTVFHRLGQTGAFSLVLVRPITGRKHQIRAHAEILGHPLIGDKLYSFGGEVFLKRCDEAMTAADLDRLGAAHHLLHAYALRIRLPDGEGGLFFSPWLPVAFAPYLASFAGWEAAARRIIAAEEHLEGGIFPALPVGGENR